jgi:hypothetical protein
MNLEWTNPPAAKRGRTSTKWSQIAAQLKANPNTWAKIGTVKFPSQASVIAKTHNIKVVTRKVTDGAYDVYAMHEAA